jgi:hypothetical protein
VPIKAMPKPEIEFTHVSELTSALLTPSNPLKSGNATIRILFHDSEMTGQVSSSILPAACGAP